MDFDVETALIVVGVSVISSVVLALMWLSMRHPSYDEVVASQANRLKLLNSLGSGKKEKADKKKDKPKQKGKKKETSEEEETSNQTDELTDTADSSSSVRKPKLAKSQEIQVEAKTLKKAEPQQAAAFASKDTPVVHKHISTTKEASVVQKHANEQLSRASAPAVVSKETKPKSDALAAAAADAQDEDFQDVARKGASGKNKDKENKKVKQPQQQSSSKDAIKPESVVVNGKDGASGKENGKNGASGKEKKQVKAVEEKPKAVEEVIKVQVVQTQQAAAAEPKTKREKKKKLEAPADANGASDGAAVVGQDGVQFVQIVPQLSLTPDQKAVVDSLNGKAPAAQKTKSEVSQKLAEKPTVSDAEAELKVMVSRLKQEVEEERKRVTEKTKEAQHWGSEVHRLQQAQEQHIDSVTKGLRQQLASLTTQLNDKAQSVYALSEENRKLKEGGTKQAIDDESTRMQLKLQMEQMSTLTLKLNTAENARQNLEAKVTKLDDQLQQTKAEKDRSVRELSEELARVHAHYAATANKADVEQLQVQLQQAVVQRDFLQREKDVAWQQVELAKETERKLQAALAECQTREDAIMQLRERNLDLENLLNGRQSEQEGIRHLGERNLELEAEKQKLLVNQHSAEDALRQLKEHNLALEAEKQNFLASQNASEEVLRQLRELNNDLKQKSLTDQDSAAEAVRQLKERNLELEGEKQNILINQQAAEEAQRQLQDRNRQLEEEKAQSEAALLQLTELNVTLTADFSNVRQKIVDLETQVAANAQQQQTGGHDEETERRLQQLQAELAAQKEQNKEWDAKYSQLQSELQAKVTQLDNHAKDASKLYDEINALSEAKSAVEAKLLEAEKQQVSLAEVQAKLEQTEAQLQAKQGEVDHWKTIVPTLQKAKDEGEERVASLESQLAEAQRELSSVRDRQSASDEEKGALDAQVAQYKIVLESTEGILKKLQASVESEEQQWKEKVHSAESVLQQIRSDNQSLESELTALRTTHAQSQSELGDARTKAGEVEAVRGQLEELRAQYDAVRGERDHLFSVKDTLADVERQLHEARTHSDERVNAGEQRIKTLEEELHQGGQRIKSLEDELHGVQHQLTAAREQCDTLQSKQNGVVSSDEVAELKKRLAETEEKLAKELEHKQVLLQKLGSHDHHDGGDVNAGSAC